MSESDDYRGMFDREYIAAFDLPPGRDVVLAIARVKPVKLTMVGGKTNTKPVVWFEGRDRGFVLNKTNGKAIAGMYGTRTSGWIGKQIAIYATKIMVGDEERDCIRVRPNIPKPTQRPAAGKTKQEEGAS